MNEVIYNAAEEGLTDPPKYAIINYKDRKVG